MKNTDMTTFILVSIISLSCVVPSLSSVVCPDGESECPDRNTCCLMDNDRYGCCPLPHAVCCSDHTHCCPNGYKCNVSEGSCYVGTSLNSIQDNIPASVLKKASLVHCNNTIACPDGDTCCKYPDGYKCCPYSQGVCCADGDDCCPSGWECLPDGRCSKDTTVIHSSALDKPRKTIPVKITGMMSDNAVVCPDGESRCPSGNTCCKLKSGQYGCCPLPKAVCCSDGVHCCPNGYTCDVSSGTCNRGLSSIPFIKKQPSKLIKKEVGDVVCPGGTAECPDGNTCCKLKSGQYGCCPLPKAVCCSDGIHCCPNGYTCDVSSGACSRGLSSIPFIKKQPSKPIKKEVGDVVCPGGTAECPDGNTCCKLKSGQYGCCPLPKAVCCSDGIHCCPNGYTCDVSSGACNRQNLSIPFVSQVSSKKSTGIKKINEVNTSKCSDGSQCLDYETCCKLATGGYGCCPLPNAVCCPDHEHCCPCGYNCDISSHTCYASAKTVPVIPHRTSSTSSPGDGVIYCPDGSSCRSGETCCENESGKYACCPLQSAVCCPDKKHCCPLGFRCDATKHRCVRGNSIIPMLSKRLSNLALVPVTVPKTPTVGDDIIRFVPRGLQGDCHCGLYRTCCVGSGGEQRCCPLPNASCCADGAHCCPQGFTCDGRKGCIKK